MSAGRQILKNAGALTLARGVTAVLTLVTTVYLAQVLEPDRYGILNWGLAFLAYFSFAADLGLNVYGTREVARDTGRAEGLVGHVLMLRLGVALVLFGVYASVLWLLPKSPLFKLVVLVQGLTLFANVIGLGWVYHGQQRLGIVALRNVVASVVTLAGVFALVRAPEDVVMAAAVSVAAVVLPNAWLMVTYVSEAGWPRLQVDTRAWRGILTSSLPIAASLFLITVNTNLDQLMLGVLRTDQEVGWYAAGYRLLTAALIPSQIVFQAFLPALSSALGNDDEMQTRPRAYALSMFALGFPIAAGGLLLAPDLVALLFGAEYAPVSWPLTILFGAAALMYINVTLGGVLLAWNRQRIHSGALAVGAACNVVLNLTLIPRFGIEGAAVATLASEGVVSFALTVIYYRFTKQSHLRAGLRALLIAVVGVALPILATKSIGWPVLAILPMTGITYGAALFLFRAVDPALLRALRRGPA